MELKKYELLVRSYIGHLRMSEMTMYNNVKHVRLSMLEIKG